MKQDSKKLTIKKVRDAVTKGTKEKDPVTTARDAA
jgi:hypothetical protein